MAAATRLVLLIRNNYFCVRYVPISCRCIHKSVCDRYSKNYPLYFLIGNIIWTEEKSYQAAMITEINGQYILPARGDWLLALVKTNTPLYFLLC